MDAAERRQQILSDLKKSSTPTVARQLAKKYNVSRQVIVGDIALLRASGEDILSTPKGYVFRVASGVQYKKKIVVHHPPEQTKEELNTIVDLGGEIIDVSVEHPIYGEMNGALNISNKADVKEFVKQVASYKTSLLSDLTGGIHTHTIAGKNKETVEKIEGKLKELGFLYDK